MRLADTYQDKARSKLQSSERMPDSSLVSLGSKIQPWQARINKNFHVPTPQTIDAAGTEAEMSCDDRQLKTIQ